MPTPGITFIPGTNIPAMPMTPITLSPHVITRTGTVVLVNPLMVHLACLNSSVAYYYSPCFGVYKSCLPIHGPSTPGTGVSQSGPFRSF